mmetsp:Transcript_46780/g.108160  ORF Transcript_46780/g.108160 Transcript_46780/m.108160 type:complete len:99 (-) Transcript_46780:977-1273(-)
MAPDSGGPAVLAAAVPVARLGPAEAGGTALARCSQADVAGSGAGPSFGVVCGVTDRDEDGESPRCLGPSVIKPGGGPVHAAEASGGVEPSVTVCSGRE